VATTNLPIHVAIIMDGNGRWADAHRVPRSEGHRAGMEALRRTVRAAHARGVKVLTVYGFSTENWARPPEEVDALMNLLAEYLDREEAELSSQGVRLRAIGDLARLPDVCRSRLDDAIRRTAHNDRLDLVLALSYGGRDEIVRAVRRLLAAGLGPEDVDEAVFAGFLDTRGLPDPDLLVRTGGVYRLSNFLPWQTTYTELYVSDVLWPDFDEAEFDRALGEYATRERRFGRRPTR
jgi:undecaprenyl diphosphate synthase